MKLKCKMKSIVLLLTLVISCTACGDEGIEDIAGKISDEVQQDESVAGGEIKTEDESPINTEAPQENAASVENETAQKDDIAGGEDTQKEDAENQKSDEVAESEDVNVSLGRIQGGVYSNEYAGFACALDSTWEFYSAEELQVLPEDISELMQGTELGENMEQYVQILDMQAECANDLTGMNVLYQKMNLQERLFYTTIDEKELMEYMLTQKDMLTESYAQAGIIVDSIEPKTVTFLGEERVGLYTKAKCLDVDYYVFQLFHHDLGQYSVSVTVYSFVEDKTEEILELFYAL